MPKGRGSRKQGRGQKKSAARSGHPAKVVEDLRPKVEKATKARGKIVPASDLRRRAQAAGAGGFTREERRRSRQREQEAARVAARRLAKEAREAQKRREEDGDGE